ncbi:MAG: thiamine-phosphate kinase [Chloroflexi bacterium]|nr:thiamine-phosphate kinase [Chloroflexota bacterium]
MTEEGGGDIISDVKVSELGEFGLVELIAKAINSAPENKASKQLVCGIGDDAAAWKGDDTTQLATVDSLLQNVHFTLEITPWRELGWKALAINLSDIAAMGGVPRYTLVALAIPGHTEVDDVITLYQGMLELAQKSGVAIIGGDTDNAPTVSITVTVLGNSRGRHLLMRSTAKPGEQIAVTGFLGAAAAGYEMLSKKLQFDTEAAAALRQAFLKPEPRIAEGELLVKQGIRTAIDVSDGLVSDLKQICKASKVGARIEVERVPVHPAVKANFGEMALELALSGGEDYELLFTGSAEAIARVKKVASCPITVIGEIADEKAGEVTVLDNKGNAFNISKAGWEHFIAKP